MSQALRKGGISTSSASLSRLPSSLAYSTRPATRMQSRCLSQRTLSSAQPLMLTATRPLSKPLHTPVRVRSLATSSTTTPISSSTNTTSSPPSVLTWTAYLPLRRKRRVYNTISATITGFATFAGGVSFLLTQDLEKLSGIVFGIDPFFALGACGLAFGALGWLLGPFAGDAVFRIVNRRFIAQMEIKEKDLYRRIKKYRCDPSSTNVSNPVPDYYGEKISSVKGYRGWLKDQRNFAKKRQTITL